jgi:hypothetical protein
LNTDKQLADDAKLAASQPSFVSSAIALVEVRKELWSKLETQLKLPGYWGLEIDGAAALEAGLIMDASTGESSFHDAIPLVAESEGVDMRLLFGFLAYREGGCKAALAAMKGGKPPPTKGEDAGAVAARLLISLLASFNTARTNETESMLAAVAADAAAYNEVSTEHVIAAPAAVMNCLQDVAANEPQLEYWEYQVNNLYDPPIQSLLCPVVKRRRAADDSKLLYLMVCNMLAEEKCKASVICGGVKPVDRFIFKGVSPYILKGCFSRVYDVVRITISVDTMADAAAVAEAIRKEPTLLLLREKLRLDPAVNVSAAGGYRDVQFLIAGERDMKGGPKYFVGEIQINLAANMKIKTGLVTEGGGYALYMQAVGAGAYSVATDAYVGPVTPIVAAMIKTGLLLDVAIVSESTGVSVPLGARITAAQEGALPFNHIAADCAAMVDAMKSPDCAVQRLTLAKNAELMKFLVPKLPPVMSLTHLTLFVPLLLFCFDVYIVPYVRLCYRDPTSAGVTSVRVIQSHSTSRAFTLLPSVLVLVR